MLLIDTREHKDKIQHIMRELNRRHTAYDRTKLYIGDYQRADNPLLVIDRKQNLLEIASNIIQDHSRFKKELERLSAIDGKMYILVEEKLDCTEDVSLWKSPIRKDGTPYTRMSGSVLYKYMMSWKYKHNIEYVFCDKKETGRKILELLEI